MNILACFLSPFILIRLFRKKIKMAQIYLLIFCLAFKVVNERNKSNWIFNRTAEINIEEELFSYTLHYLNENRSLVNEEVGSLCHSHIHFYPEFQFKKKINFTPSSLNITVAVH
jgi:dolichyl-phosphate-mannose--protein O-mannosyl transferase